jgi:1-acyl-sn-glycerol-3-phosphate acyltransferase
VHGLEQVPRDRPLVYVAKHPRAWLYLETMLLGAITFLDDDRVPFRVMEKRGTSLHRLPGISWLRRHAGAIDATEEAGVAALRGGESVLVFPGGARELYGAPDVIRWTGRRGFARIAAIAGAPILPVAIGGADQQHAARLPLGGRGSVWLPPIPFPVPLDYWFGAPIPPPRPGDAAGIARVAERAAAETRALLARAREARRAPWSLA